LTNLWSQNSPQKFWLCQPDPPEAIWREAIQRALPLLEFNELPTSIDEILELTLGEGRFGESRWHLNSSRRFYYQVKPLLPRAIINRLKRRNVRQNHPHKLPVRWPIEDRYAQFLWETIRQVSILSAQERLDCRPLWPDGFQFAFVLTHDVETQAGLDFVKNIADLEEDRGFRSSFNFIPERYTPDPGLLRSLRERGFEIGIHGLKHDGKLFNSRKQFLNRAKKINTYLKEYGSVGFRAPLMHRQPEWMQALEIDYDLSFFDTDPYEPMPGGTMSIHPFFIGHFIELPYTLPQDCTLFDVLGERTPNVWIGKLKFLASYHGLALLNSHPDYLRNTKYLGIYLDFLDNFKAQPDGWLALPREVAWWWRTRSG
jgi:peptidoglycan/xylan/chitin deacetylase (PgdA/CDA1 family)